MVSSIALLRESQKVHLGNTELSYLDFGTGEISVILIHGLAGNKLLWRSSIHEISDSGFRVIAVDLPGHGQSAPFTADSYSLEAYAKTLDSLIQALGIKKVALVGHSMGAQIAIHYALKHLNKVSHLLLCSPAGFEIFNTMQSLTLRTFIIPSFLRYLSGTSLKTFIQDNFYQWTDDYNWILRYYEHQMEHKKRHQLMQVFGDSVAAMLNEPVHHLLFKIIQPTLIIAGEEDRYIPNRLFRRVSTNSIMRTGIDKIPNAELLMIPKAGHLANMEHPAIFNQAVINFLNKDSSPISKRTA